MEHPETVAPTPVIPGWRVIRSDAGRYWASRIQPFPDETEWYAPPFRTVDGDTVDRLRAEIERQEEAARQICARKTALVEGVMP